MIYPWHSSQRTFPGLPHRAQAVSTGFWQVGQTMIEPQAEQVAGFGSRPGFRFHLIPTRFSSRITYPHEIFSAWIIFVLINCKTRCLLIFSKTDTSFTLRSLLIYCLLICEIRYQGGKCLSIKFYQKEIFAMCPL